ncbi:MAG: hypothetical protein ACI4J8_08885 [Oscillospiraceae bacterium]
MLSEDFSSAQLSFTPYGCDVICVDAAMAGVGSNACGPALAEKYRLPLPKISAELQIGIRAK